MSTGDRHRLWARTWICVLAPWLCVTLLQAEVATVRGHIEVGRDTKARHLPTATTVIWLTPVPGAGGDSVSATPNRPRRLRLVQKNKSFEPHVLVIPAGSSVEFPNHDPFFHNVFSLFEGERFDLGLYEAGTSRMVRFDRPGISYIFCNIHPEMSAVVITLDTPWYAVARGSEEVSIPGVPYGRYWLHVWSEGMAPESRDPAAREITIGEGSSLGRIWVPAANRQTLAHKNMYGRDYDAPTPDNSIYREQR